MMMGGSIFHIFDDSVIYRHLLSLNSLRYDYPIQYIKQILIEIK
jgi:hypothetical protein